MVPFRILLFIAALAALGGVACSKDNSRSASDGNATAAFPTPVSSAAEPTANDISNYTLTMDRMTRWANTIKYLEEAAKADTSIQSALRMSAQENTAQTIARLEGHPAARAALRKAGWSAKDYVWTTAAWMQAAMTEGILGSTPGATLPEGQNPKNVEFLKANKKAIEQLARDAGMTTDRSN